MVSPSSAALCWSLAGHIVLQCIQLAVGGLTARLQPPLMGEEGNQGVSLHLLMLPSWTIPAEPRDLLRKSSTGTAPRSMRTDDLFCK